MRRLKRLTKRVLALCLIPFAHVLASALRFAGDTEPFFRVFNRHGYYLLRHHYYLPIPDDDDLRHVRASALTGVQMNDDQQLRLTDEVVLHYRPEVLAFPASRTGDPLQYHLMNGTFMVGDGDVYYALIRHLKPATIIEIGSGNSTLLASHAIAANSAEDPGAGSRLIAIEPYPSDFLLALTSVELRHSKLQEVDLAFFDRLGAGDILFIDSSHVLKEGGDVWMEYCELIPRLKPGVYVHVHDISTPKPYPAIYHDQHLHWNEQYVLQALLTHSDRLEVVWAGSYLFDKYAERMETAFAPEYQTMRETFPFAEPTSFWLRVREDAPVRA